MKSNLSYLIGVIAFCFQTPMTFANDVLLDVDSQQVLTIPDLSTGLPAPGKRVNVTPPEYVDSNVFHTLYLPKTWKKDGDALPIIFEYTGNYFPQSGSTGEPEDAGLGYGLSGGKYIWVSLPYISEDGTDNAVTWWGDEKATVEYAKRNVPRIMKEFGADPNKVFLCGFSRGAIGVNFIGLHDEQISSFWTAFITHDHFDGVKRWGKTTWGSPLDHYRKDALERLRRVGTRPYLVSQNGSKQDSEDYLRSVLSAVSSFTFGYVNTREILGNFPNDFARAAHTDRWLLKPSPYRSMTWSWMNRVASRDANSRQVARTLGTIIFEDQFGRSESQEEKDEPGNEWTTSSDKTAGGHKQVDLRDGTMHIETHATANHATSVRQAFQFADGTIGLRFMLHGEGDSLKLNFADPACKTVHAGHLFDAVVGFDELTFEDRKTGVMDLQIRAARTNGTLTETQRKRLATKKRQFPVKIKKDQWYELMVHVDGNQISAEIDGNPIGRFNSEGFAHPTKSLLRLLVPQTATVDDVRIWKRK